MGFRELVDVSMAVNYGLSTLKASWSPEMMSGIWKFPTADVSSPGLRAEDFEYLYLTALAFGLKGMNFYMLVNRENWESAPLDERGQLTETAPAVQKVLELFRRVPDFTTLHKAQQVAIVYYRPYAWEAFAADGQVVEDACCRMAESYARFEACILHLCGSIGTQPYSTRGSTPESIWPNTGWFLSPQALAWIGVRSNFFATTLTMGDSCFLL